MSKIGQKIKKLRTERSLTQEQLAKKAGLAWITIARIEVGLRKNPVLSTRKKLAKAFGVEIIELLD